MLEGFCQQECGTTIGIGQVKAAIGSVKKGRYFKNTKIRVHVVYTYVPKVCTEGMYT